MGRQCGQCGDPCGSERLVSEWSEASDKFCSWQPANFGAELQRLTAFQTKYRNLFYNEVIVDAPSWRTRLPEAVEAVFGSRRHHEAFLTTFGLSEETHPYLELDSNDWESPFAAGK